MQDSLCTVRFHWHQKALGFEIEGFLTQEKASETTMLKMAKQGRFDLYVVCTVILWDLNFCAWQVMKLIFTD